MLESLSSRISSVIKTISGNARLTASNIEDAIREIRIALLEADVAILVVKNFIEQVKSESLGQKVEESLNPSQAFISIVNDKLISLMGNFNDTLNLNCTPPAIILMAGLQGSGKTTTVVKLAKRLKEIDKKKVLLVSVDVYRPAAIEQLEILSKKIDVICYKSISKKPLDIAKEAFLYAKNHYFDVLLIDTAGRLSIDTDMMEEIKLLHQELDPIETLFVADAMTGQDAVNTAKAFNDVLKLSGIVLTKMDGDSRGGAALSMRYITKAPIKFIGISEKPEGLEPFYPDRIASRILGMGDVMSLIDDVRSSINEEKAQKLMQEAQSGKRFDLDSFKSQFEQMADMGGISKIIDKLPSNIASKASGIVDDKLIKRNIAIINSMTKKERKNPDLLKASRKRRVALGSGTSVQEVNILLKQYEQLSDMVKKFSGGGMFKMMKNFKHLFPR